MDTTQHETHAEHRAAAAALVALYAERVAAAKSLSNNSRPTAADVEHVLHLGDRLDEQCEAFRRRYYPRRHRVVVGLYAVIVASRTLRSTETVLDLFDEYTCVATAGAA